MKRKVLVAVLLAGAVLFPLVSAGNSFIEWMFNVHDDPLYSPFPEFAPFNASVVIQDPNTNPFIHDLDTSAILTCENTIIARDFNVTDNQGNALVIDALPFPPFYTIPNYVPETTPEQPVTTPALFTSQNLTHQRVAPYSAGAKIFPTTILAYEEFCIGCQDQEDITVTVIQTNEAPVFNPPFGTQTVEVYTQGEQSTFNRVVGVVDEEDGFLSGGNLFINQSFLGGLPELFTITPLGLISYAPNETELLNAGITLPETFAIDICVTDSGLTTTHPQALNLCLEDGTNKTQCDILYLTVTNENRAPVIESYWPTNLSFDLNGQTYQYFNVSARDPDGNPYMDMNWTVDGVHMQANYSVNFTEFNHSFACGIGGIRYVNVTITDGLANTTLSWEINVNPSPCPSSGGGGGGGGGNDECTEQWECAAWSTCQHASISLNEGVLSLEEYGEISAICETNNVPDDFCGYQLRECTDVNSCQTSIDKPETFQYCYYTDDPSCSDNLLNCHGGMCEVLVDCGGPCEACASCSDQIQNQGEQGVDCGGPCPFDCTEEVPQGQQWFLRILIWIVLILLIGVIIYKLVGIVKAHKEIAQAAEDQELALQQGLQPTSDETNQ